MTHTWSVPQLNPSSRLSIGDFDTRTNGYLAFVLWSVAALAAFRFIGSLMYRISTLFVA